MEALLIAVVVVVALVGAAAEFLGSDTPDRLDTSSTT